MSRRGDVCSLTGGQTSSVTTTLDPNRLGAAESSWRTVLLATGAVLGVTLLVAIGVAVVLTSAPQPRALLPEVVAAGLAVHSLGCLGALCAVIKATGVTARSLGVTRPSWRLLHLAWQVPATIVAAVGMQALVAALIAGGEVTGGRRLDTAIHGAQPGVLVVAVLAIAVLTPLWEELYFRGLLQARITQRWGTLAAVIATAGIFAAVHGYLIFVPYYLVLGFALSGLRVFHRSLWGALVLHVTVNSIASAVLVTSLR
ncbi:hypothetical protein C5B97_03255 [Pseudoclavibacter sp. RFBB5]|nr:hypothetical protein C5B97_03255 [Pseudoclavibacter sp. RFBB5]